MVVRVSGVTFSNIQERLQFLSQFRPQDLTVSLEREADNSFDTNAIKVRVHIPAIRKQTEIGYIPAQIAKELAKAIDIGCEIKATLKGIIGGVSNTYKVQKLNQLIRGWINYFKTGSMKKLCERLDEQIRYLRMCIWKHWKTPKNRVKNLMKLGVDVPLMQKDLQECAERQIYVRR